MQLLSTWGTVNLQNTVDLSQPLKIKMYNLFLHLCVCVTAIKRKMSVICGFWGQNSDKGQTVLYCMYILV